MKLKIINPLIFFCSKKEIECKKLRKTCNICRKKRIVVLKYGHFQEAVKLYGINKT